MSQRTKINQEMYDDLGEIWYTGQRHPIALLRAEAAFRLPWIRKQIEAHARGKPCAVLDVGCGGGLLTNELVKSGHEVFGVDLSAKSLEVAAKHDATRRVRYSLMSAYRLEFAPSSMDVVCVLDVLEHLEEPERCFEQVSRVLKPGGLLIFYTFNRTWKSWLFAMKAMDWIFRNGPKHVHSYKMFITPAEAKAMADKHGLMVQQFLGVGAKFPKWTLFPLLFKGEVPRELTFQFCDSLSVGYYGLAKKM